MADFIRPELGDTDWYDEINAYFDDIEGAIGSVASGFNVKNNGALGDGVTDDTEAIQNTLNDAGIGGGEVIFPAGTYSINLALSLPPRVSMRGEGPGATIIQQTNGAANGIQLTSTSEITALLTISNMAIYGPGTGSSKGILVGTTAGSGANPTTYLRLSGLQVRDFGGDGVHLMGPIVSDIHNVVVTGCGGHGFNLDGSYSWVTSLALSACYANACGQSGYRVNKATYMTFSACATDSCVTGYDLNDVSTLTIVGSGCEVAQVGFKINGDSEFGSSTVNLVGCYALENTVTGIWWTGYSGGVMTGTRIFNSSGTPPTSLRIDSTAAVTATGCIFTGPQNITGQFLGTEVVDAVGNPIGISKGGVSPYLLPWTDSIQIHNRAATQVNLLLKAYAAQASAMLALHNSANANVLTVYPNGTMAFGAAEDVTLAKPAGGSFLVFNKPTRPGMYLNMAALPAASANYGCVAVVEDNGSGATKLVISNGTTWSEV